MLTLVAREVHDWAIAFIGILVFLFLIALIYPIMLIQDLARGMRKL